MAFGGVMARRNSAIRNLDRLAPPQECGNRTSMPHPYVGLPSRNYWKSAVSSVEPGAVDPVSAVKFLVGRDDAIATAGSCFAQHISEDLSSRGYNYLVTETAPSEGGGGYGVFPARFGNIYTSRQLLQLFERAYGIFRPVDEAWPFRGGFVDPFRPRVEVFSTVEALEIDRRKHLAAVRQMFESCTVFVFTLGLTECWMAPADGAVFPLAPGVHGGDVGPGYAFINFSVEDVVADLRSFLEKLRVVNPQVRVILTVSPVPLIATYENRSVILSTTYSKAVLRVAAEVVCNADAGVFYFPSYEIVTTAANGFLADDRRTVTRQGVARVMDLFAQHLLVDGGAGSRRQVVEGPAISALIDQEEVAAVICDEEALVS